MVRDGSHMLTSFMGSASNRRGLPEIRPQLPGSRLSEEYFEVTRKRLE